MRDVVQQIVRRNRVDSNSSYRMLGVRWYSGGCFVRDTVTDSDIKAHHVYAVVPGDFIYNRLFAWKGSFALVPSEFEGCFVSNEFPTFIVDKEKLAGAYLLLLFSQPYMWKRAAVLSTGTTSISRNRLNEDDLLALRIALPPLQEQNAIVAVLEAVESSIQKTGTVLDQLVRAKRATMRKLLTVGHPARRTKLMRLPEPWRIGRVAPNLKSMPENWRLVTLTEVARLESGHTPSRNHPEYWEGDIPWISLQDTARLRQLVISDTAETTGELGIKNSSARLLPKDTVVFSRTASVGLAARMGREMATSQDFANWICGQHLDPRYLVQVFRHMDREWRRLQAGSTHQTVYMPVFKKLKILLPPRDEQEAIADIGDAFDERILAERKYLDQLRESKRGLAQVLLSGRVRVRARKQKTPSGARNAGGP